MKDSPTRFTIVTDKRELALPACSAFNRSQNEEYFIDTDLDGDDGRIYIGKTDAELIAKLIGWTPSNSSLEEASTKLKEENNALRTTLFSLTATARSVLELAEKEPEGTGFNKPKGSGRVITAGGIVDDETPSKPVRSHGPADGEDDDGISISV